MENTIKTEMEIDVCFRARMFFSFNGRNEGEITHITFPKPFPQLDYGQRRQAIADMNAEIQRIREDQQNRQP